MKSLWDALLIVSFGEVVDGAFPSSVVGATESLFEELRLEARELTSQDALKILNQCSIVSSKLMGQIQKRIR